MHLTGIGLVLLSLLSTAASADAGPSTSKGSLVKLPAGDDTFAVVPMVPPILVPVVEVQGPTAYWVVAPDGAAAPLELGSRDSAFDLYLTLQNVSNPGIRVELQAENETLQPAFQGQNLLRFDHVPPLDTGHYWIRFYAENGTLARSVGPLDLNGATATGAASCQQTATSGNPVDYWSAAGEQASVSTSGIPLVAGAFETDWAYTDGFTTTTRNDAYSFGYGFYGANQYAYGRSFDIALGLSWIGSSHVRPVYVNECRGYVSVGDQFTVDRAQAFYRDVKTVVASHEFVHQMGEPSEECDEVMHGWLWGALRWTRVGEFIETFMDSTWCDTNWSPIRTNTLNTRGLGVEVNKASAGGYEGAEGFIRTHYSSAGELNMELDGYGRVNAYMNACERCTPAKFKFWHGFSLVAEGAVSAL